LSGENDNADGEIDNLYRNDDSQRTFASAIYKYSAGDQQTGEAASHDDEKKPVIVPTLVEMEKWSIEKKKDDNFTTPSESPRRFSPEESDDEKAPPVEFEVIQQSNPDH